MAIYAVLLRAACSLFNRLAGVTNQGVSQQNFSEQQMAENWNTATPQAAGSITDQSGLPPVPSSPNPFASPATVAAHAPSLPLSSSAGVPVPNFGRAFLIGLAAFAAHLPIGLGLVALQQFLINARMAPPIFLVATNILFYLIGFIVQVAVLAKMLPTTLGKSALVSLLFVLIYFFIVILIGGVVILVMYFMSGIM
ncbi:MAG: hypothetical protein KF851_15450 [Pirellulaceae bacterium]|nr:hypothetical protein [Pirellulaceae bacterium]